VLSTVLTVRAVPVRSARKERPLESMPAPTAAVTVGVDTHLDLHVAAVLDHTGRLLATQAFPASTRGYVALVTWAERFGPVERIGVEGTGTYGAGLARFVRAYGLEAVEVTGLIAACGGGKASRTQSTPRPPPERPRPGWPPPRPRLARAKSR
jgi:Transposase